MDDADRKRPLPVPEPVRIPPPNTLMVVFTTLPDEETAAEIADVLVGEHLAACVTLMAPARSVYRWRGEIENADEVPLLIKTAADRLPALQARLKDLHPYDVPEILAWRPDAAWPAYSDWVIAETRAPRRWPR